VGIVGKFGNQMALSSSNKKREPRPSVQVCSPGLSSFGPPWFGGPAQSPPKSETEDCRRNAPR
jgi:hypothetical protein